MRQGNNLFIYLYTIKWNLKLNLILPEILCLMPYFYELLEFWNSHGRIIWLMDEKTVKSWFDSNCCDRLKYCCKKSEYSDGLCFVFSNYKTNLDWIGLEFK